MLRKACEEARRWLAEFGAAAPFVSVNLAMPQMYDSELVRDVQHTLDECGLPPHRLQLGLTESAIMGIAEKPMETLRTLYDMGVRIAIDDFGTGYLKVLSVHELKIAGSFMEGLRGRGGRSPRRPDRRDSGATCARHVL